MAQEQKTGVIESYFDSDTGTIRESGSGAPRDFYHPGARAEFVEGDAVTYLLVTLPNGRPPIINDIRKPN